MTIFSRFLKDESGATAIEYGLIAALVGVALIGALGTMEDGLSGLFTSIGSRSRLPRLVIGPPSSDGLRRQNPPAPSRWVLFLQNIRVNAVL